MRYYGYFPYALGIFFISIFAMQWFMSNLGVKVLYFSNFGVLFFANAWVCRVYTTFRFPVAFSFPRILFKARKGKEKKKD